MKKDLKKRLKSYSLTAGAVIAAGTAEGQVIYTDVNPDITKSSSGDFYDLDLNNDATVDFRINVYKSTFSSPYYSFYFSSNSVSVYPQGINRVAVDSSTYALAMSNNVAVGPANPYWSSGSVRMAQKIAFTYFSYSSVYFWGNWTTATDKYLGLRLVISGQTHYGWARLDVNINTGSFTIKDYAYNAVANQQLITGTVPADIAKNIAPSDVDENSDGSDMQVTFNKAGNESTVDEYRVIVVKSASAGSFDITAAQAVAAGNYTSVLPTGSNISINMGAGAKDKDGDDLTIGVPYRVFVLSIADGVNAKDDALSAASPIITLNTTCDVAVSLNAQDIDNNGTAQDMEISFNKAPDESGIAEYRAIVVKGSDTTALTVAKAKLVPAGSYTSFVPNGSNVQQALNNGDKDKDGDFIAQLTPYRFYVLSIANGTSANVDNISGPSNDVTLTPFTGVNELNATNVSVYANGRQVTVDLGKSTFAEGSIRITDVAGKLVGQYRLQQPKTVMNLEVNNGVYFVTIEADGQQMTQKVMLNR